MYRLKISVKKSITNGLVRSNKKKKDADGEVSVRLAAQGS